MILLRSRTPLYDAYGRLEKVVDPLQGVTLYAYDAMSHLTSLTDANGHTTAFHYDGYGRVDTVTYPSGAFPSTGETFTYDAVGRLLTKTDRRGVVTTFAYYDDGRLWKKTYSGGTPPVTDPPEVFTYDPAGHLLTAANGTDTLTWAYDLAGQLLSEQSTKNASTVAYTYDLGGNRLSLSLDGTLFVSYAYDDASRLTTITKGASVFGLGRLRQCQPAYLHDLPERRLDELRALVNAARSVADRKRLFDGLAASFCLST